MSTQLRIPGAGIGETRIDPDTGWHMLATAYDAEHDAYVILWVEQQARGSCPCEDFDAAEGPL